MQWIQSYTSKRMEYQDYWQRFKSTLQMLKIFYFCPTKLSFWTTERLSIEEKFFLGRPISTESSHLWWKEQVKSIFPKPQYYREERLISFPTPRFDSVSSSNPVDMQNSTTTRVHIMQGYVQNKKIQDKLEKIKLKLLTWCFFLGIFEIVLNVFKQNILEKVYPTRNLIEKSFLPS